MIILIAFAFLAGIVTILSPCILPVLPIILSSTVVGGKRQPLGVVSGFILSFTFFTLFLSAIVGATGISADSLRIVSVIIILLFGLILIIPKFYQTYEILASKLSSKAAPKSSNLNSKTGFWVGFPIGVSLGLIWTPCVGPILAAVISLALTGSVSGQALFITLAYSLGTALPMIAIVYGGRALITKVPGLTKNLAKIQKIFGILMIVVALMIAFGYDRKFQTYILEKFPNYGVGLTKFEDNDMIREKLQDLESGSEQKSNADTAPEIISDGEWFNSGPLTIAGLKGRVVLIDFWTYSCINCIRTLPYIQSWHEKYKDHGLTIIGVHAPEFEFEKNPENVKEAIKDFGLTYAIVQDNDFKTWRAYNNRFWPAKYLIDADGQIRYTHFGEGEYDETEKMIQELLQEADYDLNDMTVQNQDYEIYSKTPETYLGYQRMDRFASNKDLQSAETLYTIPDELQNNHFAFGGLWSVGPENAFPGTDATLVLNFEAKNVFLVMNPRDSIPGKVKVFLDGQEIQIISVDSDKLYQLVELDTPGRHTLKLQFLDNNTEVYAFTFG